MKPTLDSMPPLDRGDAPWTAAEKRVREALLDAEATPPQHLEEKVMESLHASPSGPSFKPWLWGAALIMGGVILAIQWDSVSDQTAAKPSLDGDAPALLEERPSVVDAESPANGSLQEPDEAFLNEDAMSELDWSGQSQDEAVVERNGDAPTLKLEALQGLPAVTMGREDNPSPSLQEQHSKSLLERRPANLEVKQ